MAIWQLHCCYSHYKVTEWRHSLHDMFLSLHDNDMNYIIMDFIVMLGANCFLSTLQTLPVYWLFDYNIAEHSLFQNILMCRFLVTNLSLHDVFRSLRDMFLSLHDMKYIIMDFIVILGANCCLFIGCLTTIYCWAQLISKYGLMCRFLVTNLSLHDVFRSLRDMDFVTPWCLFVTLWHVFKLNPCYCQ